MGMEMQVAMQVPFPLHIVQLGFVQWESVVTTSDGGIGSSDVGIGSSDLGIG